MLTPAGIRELVCVTGVEQVKVPPFTLTKPNTPARRAGVRYEKKLGKFLLSAFAGHRKVLRVQAGPWLMVSDARGISWCQPDFVMELERYCIVLEAKVSHTERAWWQLVKTYRPAVSAWKRKPVLCVEVTKSFDPDVFMPAAPKVVFTLQGFELQVVDMQGLDASGDQILVWQWKGDSEAVQEAEWLRAL